MDDKLKKQQEQYKRQFGSEQPWGTDICRYCGKMYGLHYGSNCPVISQRIKDTENGK